jgi:putative phage-type endonuclease
MIAQGTPEWRMQRCGLVTASRISDLMARTKTGYGASRANYMAELTAERLTGVPAEGFTSAAMQWGTEKEPDAKAAYEFLTDAVIMPAEFVPHPSIPETGASPDGYIGDDGLIEIKCPNTATHIETLLGGSVPGKYALQMQWQMACTSRQWCDFASFDPRMPPAMQLFVRRLERDDAKIAEIEADVMRFLDEIGATVSKLRALYA